MRKTIKKLVTFTMAVSLMIPGANVLGTEVQDDTIKDVVIANETDVKIASVHNPIVDEESGAVTFCAVYLGSYPQSEVTDAAIIARLQEDVEFDENNETIDNGKKYRRVGVDESRYEYFQYEPLKWYVMNVNGTEAILQTSRVIESKAYNTDDLDCAWYTATLRNWLNSYDENIQGFMETAFTKGEINCLQPYLMEESSCSSNMPLYRPVEDKVFLLSNPEMDEFTVWLPDFAKQVFATDYARAASKGAFAEGAVKWWLRNASYYDLCGYAATINEVGEVCWYDHKCYHGFYDSFERYKSEHRASDMKDEGIGVCPAIKIDLMQTDVWKTKEEVEASRVIKNCCVKDIQWIGEKAIIECEVSRPCQIIVGYYDEQEERMIQYERGELAPGRSQFRTMLDVDSEQIDKIRVYLVDLAYNELLCPSYSEPVDKTKISIIMKGNLGDNITYTLNQEGVLDISGTGVMAYVDSPFAGDRRIKEVVIHEGVESIGAYMFAKVINLEKITIPSTVTKISHGAFYSCKSLESIELPENLSALGTGVFSGCVALKEVKMPAQIKNIGPRAFSNCSSLTYVSIPTGIEYIYYSTFYNCSQLREVVIPEGVTELHQWAFEGCKNLEKVVFPNSLTQIGHEAFSGCENLKYIDLPEGIQLIDSYAFSNCGLVDVILPKGGVKTDWYSFGWCDSLKTVVIQEGITNLGNETFGGCVELEKVIMPPEGVEMKSDVFEGCEKVKTIQLSQNEIDIKVSELLSQRVAMPESVTSDGVIVTPEAVTSDAAIVTPEAVTSDGVIVTPEAIQREAAVVEDVVKDCDYLVVIVKDTTAASLFVDENVLYINQFVAQSDKLSFYYYPDDVVEVSHVLVFHIKEISEEYVEPAKVIDEPARRPIANLDEDLDEDSDESSDEGSDESNDKPEDTDDSKNEDEDTKQDLNQPVVNDRPLGDVTQDDKISLEDARFVLKLALKIVSATEDSLFYGDVDLNGYVELNDAQMVLKAYLKIIDLE